MNYLKFAGSNLMVQSKIKNESEKKNNKKKESAFKTSLLSVYRYKCMLFKIYSTLRSS